MCSATRPLNWRSIARSGRRWVDSQAARRASASWPTRPRHLDASDPQPAVRVAEYTRALAARLASGRCRRRRDAGKPPAQPGSRPRRQSFGYGRWPSGESPRSGSSASRSTSTRSFRLAVGPLLLPVRSLVLAASVSPAAYMLLALRLPGLWGAAGAGFVLAMAASFGLPERQGVWIGTHLAYRHAWRLLPSMVSRGAAGHARVRRARRVRPRRPASGRTEDVSAGWCHDALRLLTPGAVHVSGGIGLLRLDPGGHRGVMVLEGPAVSLTSDGYLEWCRSVGQLVAGTGLPGAVPHADDPPRPGRVWRGVRPARRRVAAHAPARDRARPREHARRDHARACATTSCWPALSRRRRHPPPRRRLAGDARREPTPTRPNARCDPRCALAPGFAVEVRAADRDDIAALLAHTPLGASRAHRRRARAAHRRPSPRRGHHDAAARRHRGGRGGGRDDACSRFRLASLHVLPVAPSSRRDTCTDARRCCATRNGREPTPSRRRSLSRTPPTSSPRWRRGTSSRAASR